MDIVVSHLWKSYGEKTVFAGFSCQIPRGSRCAVLAPSGSGKTAVKDLVETLAGMLEYADLGLNNKKKAHNIAASIHHTPVMVFDKPIRKTDRLF